MKRRQVLGMASSAAVAALWPAWLRAAFADTPACDVPAGALARVAALSAAMKRGREAGRPLLVCVIPEDDMAKWERGHAFGELLNHGDDVQLAPLARVEVACATMADLKRLVPNAGAGEPMMVLVATDRVPAPVRQINVTLSAYPTSFIYQEGETREQREKTEDAISDQRIAAMADAIRGAVGADDAHAADLAKEVRARLVKRPLAGSRWAKGYGCGAEIEGDKDSFGVACGMGHVPKKSTRFLYFFTKQRG